ncbi:MAG: hypothetical protein HY840_09085 [Bacteroidetes bacterium]|nr:hypothetical protein [Bacteroidota bacterium]
MANKPKTITKHIIGVLKNPRAVSDKIVKAQFVQKSLTGNVNFPVPYPANVVSLAQLGTDITALVAAETAAKSKAVGTVDARNAALIIVLSDLRSILQMVQAAADKAPANAETIIIGAGYDVKRSNPHGKQQNTASDGNEEGTVLLTAEGTGPHEWRMSTDQAAWTALPSSRTAKTKVSGLTVGVKYFFQNRQLLTKGDKSDWSQSVAIRVR